MITKTKPPKLKNPNPPTDSNHLTVNRQAANQPMVNSHHMGEPHHRHMVNSHQAHTHRKVAISSHHLEASRDMVDIHQAANQATANRHRKVTDNHSLGTHRSRVATHHSNQVGIIPPVVRHL